MSVYVFELCIYNYTISSPYLLVIGDDCVIRYTRLDDVIGNVGEA